MVGPLKRLFSKVQLDETVHVVVQKVDDVGQIIRVEYSIEYVKGILEDPEIQTQLMAMIFFFSMLMIMKSYGGERIQQMKGEHTLNLAALNDVCILGELFLAYLNAAVLEPVLAISGMEEVKGPDLIINILSLASIFWWLWLLTDAFNYDDVMQCYKYHVDIKKELADKPDRTKYAWLKLDNSNESKRAAKRSLTGTMSVDVALWFMLACIGTAWLPGPISHRDVIHCYNVVLLWIIMHHGCRKATIWNSSYFVTFLNPSTALLPLEYCLPLNDVGDVVEDLDFVESYRNFVTARTGVELIIES